jgi:hypothetical protein
MAERYPTAVFRRSRERSLQRVEEPPVGVEGDELLGIALVHSGLVQGQGVEAYRNPRVIFAPISHRK